MSAEPCTDAQDAAGSLMVENLVAADPQLPDTRSSCRLAAGNKMVARLAVAAKLGFKAHPHTPLNPNVHGVGQDRGPDL
jgi:hypothetical protein